MHKIFPKMFVYSQDDKNVWMNMAVLLPKFFMITRLPWIEKQVTPPGYLILNLKSDFALFLLQGDWWQYESGRRKQGFHDGDKFSIKWLSALKTFSPEKGNYSSHEFSNFPICYWRSLRKLSSLCPASGI